MFLRPTLEMDQYEWTAADVEVLAFFGGGPTRGALPLPEDPTPYGAKLLRPN
jgi:hypothetical protein